MVVPNRTGNSVSIIDAASRRVRAIFEGCPGASDAVDAARFLKGLCRLLRRAPVDGHHAGAFEANPGGPDRLEAMMDVGRAPVHLALKPDGGELFVSNALSDSISEVVTTTNDVGGAYVIGDDPVRGIVSSDNSLLYVANRALAGGHHVLDRRRQAHRLHPRGRRPSAMAFSAAGHLLFVVDSRSGDVAVVRTATHSLFTMLPAGRGPNAIAVKAFTVK